MSALLCEWLTREDADEDGGLYEYAQPVAYSPNDVLAVSGARTVRQAMKKIAAIFDPACMSSPWIRRSAILSLPYTKIGHFQKKKSWLKIWKMRSSTRTAVGTDRQEPLWYFTAVQAYPPKVVVHLHKRAQHLGIIIM
jgi:hypothetical protein